MRTAARHYSRELLQENHHARKRVRQPATSSILCTADGVMPSFVAISPYYSPASEFQSTTKTLRLCRFSIDRGMTPDDPNTTSEQTRAARDNDHDDDLDNNDGSREEKRGNAIQGGEGLVVGTKSQRMRPDKETTRGIYQQKARAHDQVVIYIPQAGFYPRIATNLPQQVFSPVSALH